MSKCKVFKRVIYFEHHDRPDQAPAARSNSVLLCYNAARIDGRFNEYRIPARGFSTQFAVIEPLLPASSMNIESLQEGFQGLWIASSQKTLVQ